MWFGQFNASNLTFVFPPEEITSGRFPPLNGMKNLFFVGTLNGMGSTDILNILNHFQPILVTHIAYLLHSHISKEK